MAVKAKQVYTATGEQEIMSQLWDPQLSDNLRAYVMFVWPWGKKGTPLENFKEPRSWQIEDLEATTDHIRSNRERIANGRMPVMWQDAKASGRGIGKSALVAWKGHWMMTTRLGSSTIVTANTEAQLMSRTMAEVGKWHTMSMNSHWFDRSAMGMRPAEWFETLIKDQLKTDTAYYYLQAQLWSEERPDAFAGVHNHNGVMLVFDEASGIPQAIWDVSDGFFTEPIPDRYWNVYSNPRNNTGAFFECFHKFRAFWRHQSIDARTVEGTDRTVYDRIIKQHGADSDQARVEVYGKFPNAGARQFIPMGHIEEAQTRELIGDQVAGLVMGIDVARYGEDSSRFAYRRGRDARTIPWETFRGLSTMELADRAGESIDRIQPDAVVIDANGVGGGVADRLIQLGYRVHQENTQGAPRDKAMYWNRRAELCDKLKDWLRFGAIDPNDKQLEDDLKGPEYSHENARGALQIENKEKMKQRGLASPDGMDALALTFAVSPAPSNLVVARRKQVVVATGVDFDVLG